MPGVRAVGSRLQVFTDAAPAARGLKSRIGAQKTMSSKPLSSPAQPLSVAPMMDWTDRHCRVFHRMISRHTHLYTEMITAPALVRGGARHLLAHEPCEHPLTVQLGGSDPAELGMAARICTEEGFQEVNLNVGCPSDRVRSGCFGAVLMRDPKRVAECAAAIAAAAPDLRVTVKCRIGVDEQDPQVVLPGFLDTVARAGVRHFVIHARKAWLQGLSPKENRDIPPLDPALVVQMKRQFPQLQIAINGGVTTLDEARQFMAAGLDGVMVGRAAYHTPYDVLARADRDVFGDPAPVAERAAIVARMKPYIARHLAQGGRLHAVTRHMSGLFAGQPGARGWRRVLSEGAQAHGAGLEVLDAALGCVVAEDAAVS